MEFEWRETPKSAKEIKVIETISTRGSGYSGNPIRLVTQYWSLDGKLLAERDDYKHE